MRQPAKVLSAADVRRLLESVRESKHPKRNKVIVCLSFRAGLRAGEIARLEWSMVLGAHGQLSNSMTVPGGIAKNGRTRRIPVHPELRKALQSLHRECRFPRAGPVVRSQRPGRGMAPKSIVNWFRELYAREGFQGCSSHSGRRTFITNAARLVARVGGSLRDVQELAGHRALTTTERYIEGNREAQQKLVRLL